MPVPRTWVLGLLLVGCDVEPAPIDPEPDPCPEGMQVPSHVDVFVPDFVLNGIPMAVAHEPGIDDAGIPAACIDEDGQRLELLLHSGAEVLGLLTIDVDEVGAFALTEPVHLFRLELTGVAEPVSFQNGPDFESGIWSTRSVGAHLDVEVDGFASANEQTLQVLMFVEAFP